MQQKKKKTNTLDILKQSQLELLRKKFPPSVEERNKKDKLYNEIIHHLDMENFIGILMRYIYQEPIL